VPDLHLASLNVCGLPSSMPPVTERAPEFCRRLDATDLDVINFQEVWSPRALAAIRAGLPSFPHVAWRRGLAGQPSGGLATFSRRPFGAVRYRSFRGAMPDRGGPRFRAKRAVNSLLQGVLTVALDGLVVANTHLTANKDGDWSGGNRYHGFQRGQLAVLHRVLRRARVTVVTGDFNIASSAPLYPRIVDGGAWHDPFADADPVTYHADFLPPGFPAHRIDYVLVDPDVPVLDTGVMFTEPVTLPDGRRTFLSDHLALTARLALPR
jgi:endonuclease/exonuclease/phosphatase family metal-dependent hydrolase